MYINLEMLSLFRQPRSVWDVHKESKSVYSNCHKLTKCFLQQGLIKVLREEPSKNNPLMIKTIYGLTENGKKILEIFKKEKQKCHC